MEHIYEFLKEILYHPDKNPEDYEIGYQHNKSVIKVKFTDIIFEEKNRFSFLIKRGEETVDIPFHRVRVVWHKGAPIWWREVE